MVFFTRSLWLSCLTLLTAALSAPTLSNADEHWTVDFAKAKAAAAEGKKSILMEFTGSDWCPPCIALHNKVLVTEAFLTQVPKDFVLLKLDSPRDKSKQTEQEIAQYKELSAKFKIRGVPTVVLCDAEGKPYAQFVGYGGQAPDAYIAQLTDKLATLKQRDEFLAKAENAQGAERAKLLDSSLALIDAELALSTYRSTVDEIMALDADNAAGLKSKYEVSIRNVEAKEALTAITRAAPSTSTEERIAKIDDLIAKYELKDDLLQQALYYKGVFLARTDADAAEKILLVAKETAPNGQFAATITRQLAAMAKAKEAAAAKDKDKSADK